MPPLAEVAGGGGDELLYVDAPPMGPDDEALRPRPSSKNSSSLAISLKRTRPPARGCLTATQTARCVCVCRVAKKGKKAKKRHVYSTGIYRRFSRSCVQYSYTVHTQYIAYVAFLQDILLHLHTMSINWCGPMADGRWPVMPGSLAVHSTLPCLYPGVYSTFVHCVARGHQRIIIAELENGTFANEGVD